MKFNEILGAVKGTVVKRSPEILVGMGISGLLTTTVLAVKATPKALRLIDEAENEKNADLTRSEIVKACWKCYIPAAVTAAVSVSCIIGASSIHTHRNAALTAAYTLSDTALREYKAKVIETIGKTEEHAIIDRISKDKVEKEPVSSHEVMMIDKDGALFYDSISGRYFTSTMDKIKAARNELNSMLNAEMYASLNDFYYEIGLPNTKIGDNLGWRSVDGLVELYYSTQMSEDGRPCVVINYETPPKYGYSSLC